MTKTDFKLLSAPVSLALPKGRPSPAKPAPKKPQSLPKAS
jgi:hypothetical protein